MRGPSLRETISQLLPDPVRCKASFGKQKMKMNSSPQAIWVRVNSVSHLTSSSSKSAQVTAGRRALPRTAAPGKEEG